MLGVFVLMGALAIDGDTLISEQHRVRLWGIDAPEMSEVRGPRSKLLLQRLVDNSSHLTCYEMGRDRYGRTVARCDDDMGVDIACLMISMDAADDWVRYSNGYYGDCYVD